MNKVTVIIEQEHEPGQPSRIEVSTVFASPDFTRDRVLDVFENALRAAGYHCPLDGLSVDDAE